MSARPNNGSSAGASFVTWATNNENRLSFWTFSTAHPRSLASHWFNLQNYIKNTFISIRVTLEIAEIAFAKWDGEKGEQKCFIESDMDAEHLHRNNGNGMVNK